MRFETAGGAIELPVKLRVHDSIFVPLAKWAMLMAGNYRCITKDGIRTAQEAVHSNLEESRSVYNFVVDVCVKLGAKREDLVPFEKYAAAAKSLSRPASAARCSTTSYPRDERRQLPVRSRLSETSSGWRLTEYRAMLSCNERSFQAHGLDGFRSISVAGSA